MLRIKSTDYNVIDQVKNVIKRLGMNRNKIQGEKNHGSLVYK